MQVWRLKSNDEGELVPEYCATLSRHSRPVNCVRFSHSGDFLASAGDGGILIIWRQSEHPIAHSRLLGEEEDEGSEYWAPQITLRVAEGEDIYDLSWSPDDQFLLVGLTDNTARIWEISSRKTENLGCNRVEKCVKILRDHQHFVQGVAWDPLGRYLVTESCDRSVKIWKTFIKKNGTLQALPLNKLVKSLSGQHLFHDETLVSFFRRPSFTPDGGLVLLPAGVNNNSFYILSRGQINGMPIAQINGFDRPVLGIRCNPHFFQPSPGSFIARPYRMVYAVFTMDLVAIFDTSQTTPILTCRDLHYGSLTDAGWSADGYSLVITSTDGFCSLISFTSEELGELLPEQQQSAIISELKATLEKKTLLNTNQLFTSCSKPPSSDLIDLREEATSVMQIDTESIMKPLQIHVEPELLQINVEPELKLLQTNVEPELKLLQIHVEPELKLLQISTESEIKPLKIDAESEIKSIQINAEPEMKPIPMRPIPIESNPTTEKRRIQPTLISTKFPL